MLFKLALTALALFLADASPIELQTRNNYQLIPKSNISVVGAQYDGKCFYPKPDAKFQLNNYLGRWYQVAGTGAPFTAGCSCVYAEYSLNANGTVNVYNSCQIQGRNIKIQGTASAVDKAYGNDGVFQVQFPGTPGPECPGPNYIVQEYANDGWAIVQASNFTTLFLLSRNQNPSQNSINYWLEEAGRLGTNLTEVIQTNQTGCLFT